MYVGPDGALYVLDYYRKVIESPEWMSKEAIKAGGLDPLVRTREEIQDHSNKMQSLLTGPKV